MCFACGGAGCGACATASAPGEGAAATVVTVAASGGSDIDGLLSGLKWNGTVSCGFPDSASDYSASYGYGEPLVTGFAQISAAQQQTVHTIMGQVAGYTNLTIQFAGTNDADIKLAQSSEANPTAYAYYPSVNEGGDVWFATNYDCRSPKLGGYEYLTHIHELGHALGLKHSHQTGGVAGVAVPAAHDGLEYTVMSYRSYIGGPATGYTNEAYGYPTTFMMNDIRALQEMHSADFTTQSGDTVYAWNASTGEFSIDGTGQGRPGGPNAGAAVNVVLMTVWDGGGRDVFDFSNYTTGVRVDLNPGSYSIASSAQLAYLGAGHYAHGLLGAVRRASVSVSHRDPSRGYDEPETLPSAITSICPTCADGVQPANWALPADTRGSPRSARPVRCAAWGYGWRREHQAQGLSRPCLTAQESDARHDNYIVTRTLAILSPVLPLVLLLGTAY